MLSELLYLSNTDIQELKLSPREAREAVLAAFRDHAGGRNISLPKSSIEIGPGHVFQSLSAASEASGLATIKWIAVVPVDGQPGTYGINGLICASDYNTGQPVAILDGNSITLIRTAAMSAAAAVYLAPQTPAAIGLVGCGSQALSHLDAFVDLFPSLSRAYLFSRSDRSARRVAEEASKKGLKPTVVNDPDALLRQSDIVVSMVPRSPDSRPFLDARSLPTSSFASAVDAGWTWYPETFPAFDRLVTDCMGQTRSPLGASGSPVESVMFQDDLGHVALEWKRSLAPRRALFCFRGFAIADLAVTHAVIARARAARVGTILPR